MIQAWTPGALFAAFGVVALAGLVCWMVIRGLPDDQLHVACRVADKQKLFNIRGGNLSDTISTSCGKFELRPFADADAANWGRVEVGKVYDIGTHNAFPAYDLPVVIKVVPRSGDGAGLSVEGGLE